MEGGNVSDSAHASVDHRRRRWGAKTVSEGVREEEELGVASVSSLNSGFPSPDDIQSRSHAATPAAVLPKTPHPNRLIEPTPWWSKAAPNASSTCSSSSTSSSG